ncbi:LacI family transcriptional regulator [Vallitalea longa]|uniref:LacI family transcriptional regulator n=1 Tax=Vallitalea longa TaxID=2936439 RepID=A0A9W5Y9Z3_9FIRM|nr:LacI family DNA-binding transcriptional regulator [Vallitalea longa]GKX28104.1 LacI family transcriptional regulator [Vallitalea longa]
MANTIYDVANLAGVSTATVSRVINKIGNVSPKTETKVKSAMEKLNFTPNSLAQSFATMKSKTIGFNISLTVSDEMRDYYIDSDYFTELFKGINRITQNTGYSILIINIKENLENIRSDFIDKKKIDGLIIGNQPEDTKIFRNIINAKLPVVYIGQLKKYNKGLHVYAQYSQYVKNVIEYLYNKNHRHIAYFGAKKEDEIKKLIKHNDDITLEYYNLLFNNKHLRETILELFNKKERPTALFYEELSGIQPVISILNELNIRVPEDISIVSVEHKKGLGNNFYPPITNVYVPVYEMGKRATKILIDYIEGNITEYNHQFDLESIIIERNSVIQI